MRWILYSLRYEKVIYGIFFCILAGVVIITTRANPIVSKLLNNVFYVFLMHEGEQGGKEASSVFSIPYFITNEFRPRGGTVRPVALEQMWIWSQKYDQDSPRWNILKGQLLLLSGDYRSAQYAFENALSASGDKVYMSRFYLGLSYELAGEREKAVQTWRPVPEISLYFLVSGRDQLDKSESLEVALRYLEIANAIAPESCEALYYYGDTLIQLNQSQAALIVWLYPDNLACSGDYFLGEIYFQRGTLLHSMGRTDEALHDLRRALDLDPQNTKRLVRLANLLTDNGGNAEAEAFYREIIRIDPGELWGYLGFCNLKRINEDYAASLTWCQQAIARFPHNPIAYFYIGLVYQDMNKLSEAIFWFEKIVNEGEPTLLMWVRLGDAYRTAGERENAVDAYEMVLEIDPDNKYALERLNDLRD